MFLLLKYCVKGLKSIENCIEHYFIELTVSIKNNKVLLVSFSYLR